MIVLDAHLQFAFTELGFGAAPLGNLFKSITEAEAQALLEAAWAAGVAQPHAGTNEASLSQLERGCRVLKQAMSV